jgi:hypothetical protein
LILTAPTRSKLQLMAKYMTRSEAATAKDKAAQLMRSTG